MLNVPGIRQASILPFSWREEVEQVDEYNCILCANMLAQRGCMLAISGRRREQKGREKVVLWKVTNRFFLVHCANGYPRRSTRQDSGIRGSRHESEWLGREVWGPVPQLSAGEMESLACRRWSARRAQEGGQHRSFPGRRLDWAFAAGPQFPLECPWQVSHAVVPGHLEGPCSWCSALLQPS